ncbi:hypothetical protein HDU96_009146, partial [Phlyctochytrium bullatum]
MIGNGSLDHHASETADASNATSEWEASIDPRDLEMDKVVAAEVEFTIENGRYQNLNVTIKSSIYKDLIEREAGFLRRATSEFVASLCGCFEEPGIFGFVTQRYAMDLTAWSSNASPSTDVDLKMLKISEGLINGLAHINSMGVIHNDIKPQSVFVDELDKAYIGDFGVATNRGEPLIGFTKQYFDRESVDLIPDEKSDGWLLGATLLEFWSGKMFNLYKEVSMDDIRNPNIKNMLKVLLQPRKQRSTAMEVIEAFGLTLLGAEN